MPSLRRTTSSPIVRANPYPTSLSSSHSTHSSMAIIRPKRTASDSLSRRVLADIEWWRVLDGQRQEEPDFFGREQVTDVIDIVHDGFGVGIAFNDQPLIDAVNAGSARPSTPINQDVLGLTEVSIENVVFALSYSPMAFLLGIAYYILFGRIDYLCYRACNASTKSQV